MTVARNQLLAEAPILQVKNLVKSYGALRVTNDVSLSVRHRELHAIIGPNGAGKTSLINQISGELSSHSGTVVFNGVDVTPFEVHDRAKRGLMRSYQITSVFEHFTVMENVMLAALGTKSHAFGFWKPLMQRKEFHPHALEALRATGLDARAGSAVSDISYGERRQLEVAMALASQPKFLLLDEPMAGMSPQECATVVALLKQLKQQYGILLIEHDMDAVFALADRVTVMVDGKVLLSGTPDEIRNHPEVRSVYLGDGEGMATSGGVH
jgi:branched-chain amino acid transport system ATP-binding protein